MPPKTNQWEDKITEILQIVQSLSQSHEETKKLLSDSLARVAALESKVSEAETKNKAAMSRCSALENRCEALENSVIDLARKAEAKSQEIFDLKNRLNTREVESRACNIRLLGLPITDSEKNATDGGKAFAVRTFEKILRPIFEAAVENGHLRQVPQFEEAIEAVYRTGAQKPNKKPPPVLIVFAHRNLRLAVLKNKKDNTPAPSRAEQDAGANSFLIVEDLTPATFAMFLALKEDQRVGKVWSFNGRLKYTLVGHDNKPLNVKSVFSDVDEFLPVKRS